MLAVSERVRGVGDEPDTLIWHLPAGEDECVGDCDFHAIACSSQDGIVLPWPSRDVPLRLVEPRERWCTDCLAMASVEPVSCAELPGHDWSTR